MIIKNEACTGALDILSLNYPCSIPFSGIVFDSLEQAMLAVMCDDQSIWQIAVSTDLSDLKSMLPEIISKRVSHTDYVERLINLVITKFSTDDIYTRMYESFREDDKVAYDFEGPFAIKQIMQPYYDIVSRLVNMYHNGVTNGLYMSEAILGEI